MSLQLSSMLILKEVDKMVSVQVLQLKVAYNRSLFKTGNV